MGKRSGLRGSNPFVLNTPEGWETRERERESEQERESEREREKASEREREREKSREVCRLPIRAVDLS